MIGALQRANASNRSSVQWCPSRGIEERLDVALKARRPMRRWCSRDHLHQPIRTFADFTNGGRSLIDAVPQIGARQAVGSCSSSLRFLSFSAAVRTRSAAIRADRVARDCEPHVPSLPDDASRLQPLAELPSACRRVWIRETTHPPATTPPSRDDGHERGSRVGQLAAPAIRQPESGALGIGDVQFAKLARALLQRTELLTPLRTTRLRPSQRSIRDCEPRASSCANRTPAARRRAPPAAAVRAPSATIAGEARCPRGRRREPLRHEIAMIAVEHPAQSPDGAFADEALVRIRRDICGTAAHRKRGAIQRVARDSSSQRLAAERAPGVPDGAGRSGAGGERRQIQRAAVGAQRGR